MLDRYVLTVVAAPWRSYYSKYSIARLHPSALASALASIDTGIGTDIYRTGMIGTDMHGHTESIGTGIHTGIIERPLHSIGDWHWHQLALASALASALWHELALASALASIGTGMIAALTS